MRYFSRVSLRGLRLRVLTILGLPALACTKQSPSLDDGEPTTVLEIPPVASAVATSAPTEDDLDEELFTHPSARAFDCGRDRTRVFVCGRSYRAPDKPAKRPYDQCSEKADSLSHDVVVGPNPGAATFDSALTARYRTHAKNDDKACCYSQCVDVKARAVASDLPSGYSSRLECITAMQRGSRHPAPVRSDCPVAVDFGGGHDGAYAAPFHIDNTEWRTKWVRERTGFQDVNLCCYQNAMRYRPPMRGRALRDADGELVFAETAMTLSWLAGRAAVDVDGLTPEARAELAARWARDAQLEHASVAAFSQLSLSLLACAAPPALVAEAHRAALDEIRHAELCFALASRYAGASLGPGPLVPPSPPTSDVVELAIETFRDGCIGETVAAVIAARSAAGCEIGAVRAALEEIAGDEERHAELGWRILRWAIASPGVREALEHELAALLREAPPLSAPPLSAPPLSAPPLSAPPLSAPPLSAPPLSAPPLSAPPVCAPPVCAPPQSAPPQPAAAEPSLGRHGWLGASAEGRARSEVVRQLVIPCTEALLGQRARQTPERDLAVTTLA